MNYEYKKRHSITYTEVNFKGEIDIISSFNLVQNMMTEYFESFESDNVRLKRNNNAIWVVTKTKLHFNKYPIWKDKVEARGFTTKIKPIRIEIETDFNNDKQEPLFSSKQECCVIDLTSRALRKVDTVDYPKDMETSQGFFEGDFSKLAEVFTEKDFVYEQKIYSSDIDFSQHTNNVAYVKYIMNTINCDFFNTYKITDFEIHYIKETKEEHTLKVYKKEIENSMEFLIKEGENEVVRAKIDYAIDENPFMLQ